MSTGIRPASKRLNDLGVNQYELAAALDRSQTWVSLQLSGRRRYGEHLDAGLRGFLLGSGRSAGEVSREIADLRRLIKASYASRSGSETRPEGQK